MIRADAINSKHLTVDSPLSATGKEFALLTIGGSMRFQHVVMCYMPVIEPQEKWKWSTFFSDSCNPATHVANECWNFMAENLKHLRLPRHIVFAQVGRKKIVEECLSHLKGLEESTLRGRNNRCILGAKHIGKTWLLKALVCLNLYLSPRTVSLFVDGNQVKSLSELIAKCIFKRWPDLVGKNRAFLESLESGWQFCMNQVMLVLEKIGCHAFIVLDDVDFIYSRLDCKVLQELHTLSTCGGDPNRVVVYLAAAATKARVLIAGKLPKKYWKNFPSYQNTSLNSTKYQFRVQRAPLFTRTGFREAMRCLGEVDEEAKTASASPTTTATSAATATGAATVAEMEDHDLTQLYVSCRGHLSNVKTDVIKMSEVFLQMSSWTHPFAVVAKAFWQALIFSNPTLVEEFQNDPFITDMRKLQVSARDVIRRLPDSDTVDYKKTFYDVSDNHLLFFDDAGGLSATLSLVHPCDISRFVFLFSTEAKSAGELSEAEVESLMSPGGEVSGALQARDLNEPLVARSLANPGGGHHCR